MKHELGASAHFSHQQVELQEFQEAALLHFSLVQILWQWGVGSIKIYITPTVTVVCVCVCVRRNKFSP